MKVDKKKIIILIVAIIIIAIAGGYYYMSNQDTILRGTTSQVSLPNEYKLNEKAIATNGKTGMYFIEYGGDNSITMDNLKAIKENGNASGYENYTESTANGYKIYEYSAKPENLKTLKYGSSTMWTEYPPMNLTSPGDNSRITCDHYRSVFYVSPNGATISQLIIYAPDADTDLNTAEINDIINSIKPVEK